MENQRKPICILLLVIINVAVFILLSMGGKTEDPMYMFEHGAMFAPAFVIEKEYYRILTSMFLHFGFEHLMNNMVTLVVVGRYLEVAVGKVRFLIIYLLSGIGGSAISLFMQWKTEDYSVSAGASGAIFGLTGALLCLAILNRGHVVGLTKWQMVIIIALSLYNGFVSEGVDNMAHIGGVLTGFCVCLLLNIKSYTKGRAHTQF